MMFLNLHSKLFDKADIAPLIVFRILFGSILLLSCLRFFWNGWIEELYVSPKFHFHYIGFEWIQPLGSFGMYFVFSCLLVLSLFIIIGLFYRISVGLFLIGFIYIELIDKTTYLNHYYFVSLICFLLFFIPTNQEFSFDKKLNISSRNKPIQNWMRWILLFQIGVVYFYAGIAKLNTDWLIHAQPLSIWLPARDNTPILGSLLTQDWVAYAFSWFGAIFDILIVFFFIKQ